MSDTTAKYLLITGLVLAVVLSLIRWILGS